MASRFRISVSCGSFTVSPWMSTITCPAGLPASATTARGVVTLYSPLLAVDAGSTRKFTLLSVASFGAALKLKVALATLSALVAEALAKVSTGVAGVPVLCAQAPAPVEYFARTRTR